MMKGNFTRVVNEMSWKYNIIKREQDMIYKLPSS